MEATGRGGMLRGDLRWAFTRPWTWLSGVAANLVLSALYLLVAPLTGRPHHDWAILVGTYFAVFVLADVTTTNVLGADHRRVGRHLADGVPLHRILVTKNVVLALVVGLPTLLATAALTLADEPAQRLELTLPGVAFPVLLWLGLGNLVSVVLPVATVSLRERWRDRRRLRPTVRWLVALGLPYGLCVAVEPLEEVPRLALHALRPTAPSAGLLLPGLVLLGFGVLLYLAGTGGALALSRHPARRAVLAALLPAVALPAADASPVARAGAGPVATVDAEAGQPSTGIRSR